MACIDIRSDGGLWVGSVYRDKKQIQTRAGRLWSNINSRCKVGGNYQLLHETYLGCTNLFKDFQTFCDWCQTAVGYTNVDKSGRYWAIDKDLLGDGKSYSEKVCLFLPNDINILLKENNKVRYDLPAGVLPKHDRNKRYVSQISVCGKRQHLGNFYTAEEAHKEWQKKKVVVIGDRLLEYQNRIDVRAIDKLRLIQESILTDINFGRQTMLPLGGVPLAV